VGQHRFASGGQWLPWTDGWALFDLHQQLTVSMTVRGDDA